MTFAEWKSETVNCEVVSLFPSNGREYIIPLRPVHRIAYSPRFKDVPGEQIHHVVGQTPKGRTDDPRNCLRVCWQVHEFLTQHTCAGRVLSATALKRAGRLDWRFLSYLDRRLWPGIFETDQYVNGCAAWDWIEKLRQKLIGG